MSGNTDCGIATLYNSSLLVANSTISNNGGIGIDVDTTDNALISNSTVSNNGGSGVFAYYIAFPKIINSTITGNSGSAKVLNHVPGRFGGGVYAGYQTTVSILNSTISGNSASKGGGIYTYNYNRLAITNSTVTRNTASSQGGGISGGADASSLDLNRTIISGNSAPNGREASLGDGLYLTIDNFNSFGFSNSSGLVGLTPGTTDIVPSQPLNRILNTQLANNGGPTHTHALVRGSPAIDAINDGTCPPPAKDQRGVKRPRDGNGDGGPACDIGAYEF